MLSAKRYLFPHRHVLRVLQTFYFPEMNPQLSFQLFRAALNASTHEEDRGKMMMEKK